MTKKQVAKKKKLNKDKTKIKFVWKKLKIGVKNQDCLEKIKQSYNKNQGCLEKKVLKLNKSTKKPNFLRKKMKN